MTGAAPSHASSNDRPGALILGGAHGSLAVARSLGRRGIPVWFVTDDHPITGFSRYVKRTLAWDGPAHPSALQFLLSLAANQGLSGWVLIAGGDAELRFMSQHHAALSSLYRITVPSWETARWAHDKRLTCARAAALGIDHPLCYHPRGRDDLARLDCRFPVILKPATRERMNAFTRAKAWRCDDLATLRSRYAQASDLVGEDAIVVQELIPGAGAAQLSYAGVWDRGFPIASMVARRTRQYPADFGYSSTFVETIEQNEVEDLACRFLRSLNHSGLAEVEFKFDVRDGRYKLLDVNARVWTWNALGAIAGVDFAHVLWRLAMGEAVTPIRGHANAAWMHDWLDVWAACREMLAGNLSPLSYLRCWGANITFAGFAGDDPLPGVVDLPIGLARVLARRLGRPGRLPIRQPDAKAACAGARLF